MALETGISIHRGPIGELGGGGSFTVDSEIQMTVGSGNRALLWEPGVGAALLVTLKDMLKKALEMGNSLHRGPIGDTWKGVRLPGTSSYSNIWAFFLGPEVVRSLSLGAFQNFSKGPGLSMTWHQSMGHKGPV